MLSFSFRNKQRMWYRFNYSILLTIYLSQILKEFKHSLSKAWSLWIQIHTRYTICVKLYNCLQIRPIKYIVRENFKFAWFLYCLKIDYTIEYFTSTQIVFEINRKFTIWTSNNLTIKNEFGQRDKISNIWRN